MHRRIRDREIRLKTKRARLGHRSALESWNQAPFGGQLDYRWPITKSYLADIAARHDAERLMLQPTNRLTLIDAMRPPAGFGLESAMAVTFTLDLRALLAAPAAFALTGADGVDRRRHASTSRSSCSTPCGPTPASSPCSARSARSPFRRHGGCSRSSSDR